MSECDFFFKILACLLWHIAWLTGHARLFVSLPSVKLTQRQCSIFHGLTAWLLVKSWPPSSYAWIVQILSWVLSYDGVVSPEPMAITAAGAALAISDIPLVKPVAGVR